MLPDWVPNLLLASFFIFCYLVFSCKIITISYRISSLDKTYKQLKGWNQYYHTQILKEFSLDRVKSRVVKADPLLEIPGDWRVIEVEEPKTCGKGNDGNRAEAATRR